MAGLCALAGALVGGLAMAVVEPGTAAVLAAVWGGLAFLAWAFVAGGSA